MRSLSGSQFPPLKQARVICAIKGDSVPNSTCLKTPEFVHGLRMLIMKEKINFSTHTYKHKTKLKNSLNSSSAQVKGSISLSMFFRQCQEENDCIFTF